MRKKSLTWISSTVTKSSISSYTNGLSIVICPGKRCLRAGYAFSPGMQLNAVNQATTLHGLDENT